MDWQPPESKPKPIITEEAQLKENIADVKEDEKKPKEHWEPPKTSHETKTQDEDEEEIEDEEIQFFDMKIKTNQKDLKERG